MALGPNVIKRESFGTAEGTLPKEIVRDIYKEVAHESLALKLAGTVPVNINGTTTSWTTGRPVAGVVGEGERKPLIRGGMARKSITPIKVAAITVESKEARLANPDGYFDQLIQMMTGAVTRAVDLAIFHGKDGIKNTVIPAVEYVDQTENAVRIGTAKPEEGGLRTDLLNGWKMVARKRGRFTSFAADEVLIAEATGATGPNGQLLFQPSGTIDLKNPMGNLMGLPVIYNNETVAGAMGAVPDTFIRAYGGDFKDNIRMGFVEQINYRRTDQATIVDGDQEMHLWQDNLEAYLIECIFGWIIKDVNHFTKYTVAPDAYQAGADYPKDSLVKSGPSEYIALNDVKSAATAPGQDTANWKKVS